VFGDASDRDGAGSAVRTKSTPTDPVTVVDTETERLLRDRLAELRPGDPVLGEEGGGAVRVEPGRPLWVLDPIDGTVNFVYGIEAYAVSVGVQIDGTSVAGAVANVATGEVFSAAVGHGARVRRAGVSTPLRCTPVEELSMALVGTGFGYSREQRARQAAVLARLLPDIRDMRRLGSCALDLCMVAAGQLDAYYEDGVHVWDWAAGHDGSAGRRRWRLGSHRRRGTGDRRRVGRSIAAGGCPHRGDGGGRRGELGVQQAPAWTLDSRELSAGCVASGRRLASTASVSSLWLRSPKSVPIARSTVSSARWS
jgi:myo-inositol-1(or 4)-monophosphatase